MHHKTSSYAASRKEPMKLLKVLPPIAVLWAICVTLFLATNHLPHCIFSDGWIPSPHSCLSCPSKPQTSQKYQIFSYLTSKKYPSLARFSGVQRINFFSYFDTRSDPDIIPSKYRAEFISTLLTVPTPLRVDQLLLHSCKGHGSNGYAPTRQHDEA